MQRTARRAPEYTAPLTDEQVRTIEEDGYLIIPDVLSQEECDRWSDLIDEMHDRETSWAPHHYQEEPGVDALHNVLRFSSEFEKVFSEPIVLAGARAILGPDIRLSLVNSRRVEQGYGVQALHDFDRARGPEVQARWSNTIWCIDEFTPLNGATRVIPGSHRASEPFVSRCKDPLLAHPDERKIVAPRGSVAICNQHLIHGGSTNETPKSRRCIHSYFTRAEEPLDYDWRELPDHIRDALSPQSLELLGLGEDDLRKAAAAEQTAQQHASSLEAAGGGALLDPVAGVSIELYSAISRDLAATAYDLSQAESLAGSKGVSPEAWRAAVAGWNERMEANKAVAELYKALLTACVVKRTDWRDKYGV